MNILRYFKSISVISLLIITINSMAQTPGNWVWVHGLNSTSSSGVFGTKGVPAPANMPPALYEACSWTDLTGNFWLFGGAQNSGSDAYNTMWKFDPISKQWVWMHGPSTSNGVGIYGTQGIPSVNNIPGARGWGVSTWTDLQGNFWLFGGYVMDNSGTISNMNDLWKFNPTTLEWTWMSGSAFSYALGVYGTMGVPNSANVPPPINENHLCWVDAANNLWLYGGITPNGNSDDLWKYTIPSSQWTWMSGSGGTGSITNPVYGPLGVESSSYYPGSRFGYTSFIDPAGYLFLFGACTSGYTSYANDVWRYNPTTNKWAYWGGTNLLNAPGSYISKCDTLVANYPEGAMEMRATWPDSCGFWVFGAYTSLGQSLNNLWYFNAESKKFTWATGSNSPDDPGNYGTQNISVATNQPPARNGAVTWNDKNGNLWMFGGELDFGLSICYNDLWMYTPDPACVPLCSNSIFNTGLNANFTGVSPGCGSLTISCDAAFDNAASYNWSFGDGVGTSLLQNPTYTYSTAGAYDVTLIVTDSTGASDTLIKPFIVPTYVSASASFTASPFSGCLPYNVNFQNSSTNATNYYWTFSNGNNSTAPNPIQTFNTAGTYDVTLIAYGANNCNDTITSSIILNNAIANAAFSASPLSGCLPFNVEFLNNSANAANYIWLFSNGASSTTANTTQTYDSAGTYNVTLIAIGAANYCNDTISSSFIVNSECETLFIPNVFSPDGNGINDFFTVIAEGFKSYAIEIYDRWGLKVFETKDNQQHWNGKKMNKGQLCSDGTYYYIISVTNQISESKTFTGFLTLLRK